MRFLHRGATWLEEPGQRRVIVTLFILLATIFTLLPWVRYLRSGTQMDYHAWFDAAQTVLQGRRLYPRSNTFPFMYPPTCALLLAIPACLGKAVMILLLCILNTAAWLFSIWGCAQLLPAPYRIALISAANAVVLVFIWSAYHLGQPSLVLLSLVLGGLFCLRARRQLSAGALVALATVIKAFPFLIILYLVYRRYWLATLSLLLALFLLLFVVPIPFRGFALTMQDIDRWQHGMLRYQASGIAQRAARGYSWKNQSIFGLANRMFREVSVNDQGQPLVYANLMNLSFIGVNLVICAAALLFGLSFILAMPRLPHHAFELEYSGLLILVLLFTPLAFGYLFSWLMLPVAALGNRVLTRNSRAALLCILIAVCLLTVTALAPRLAQIYGSVFFAAVALYFGIAIELAREKRRLLVR
jgi:hypothetical protein